MAVCTILTSANAFIRTLLPGLFLIIVIFLTGSPAVAEIDNATTVSGSITLLDRKGQPLNDRSGVVVFIDGLTANTFITPPVTSTQSRTAISHKGVQFTPRIVPIIRGTTLDFVNDDNTFHNVFSLSKPKPFDLGIYAQNTSKFVTFDTPGLVRLYCNIHPNMSSSVLVLNNQLFAMTNSDGTFVIKGVPPGKVTLRVWSEFSKEIAIELSIAGSQIQMEPIVLTQTKRIRPHKNKFGKAYKAKY